MQARIVTVDSAERLRDVGKELGLEVYKIAEVRCKEHKNILSHILQTYSTRLRSYPNYRI